MSRLGDLILLERTRQKLTRKQVARKCGVSEGYIKDVEEGRRIIQDDQARRILKTLGTSQRNEAEFSLDEIAAADLDKAGVHNRHGLQNAAQRVEPNAALFLGTGRFRRRLRRFRLLRCGLGGG